MASNKLRIYLKAYDHTLLDQSAKKIAEVAKKSGAEIAGPMPLPTKIRKYTLKSISYFLKKEKLFFSFFLIFFTFFSNFMSSIFHIFFPNDCTYS